MPIDIRCPACDATFPVTEAAAASAVECPFCEYEFTATLDRSAADVLTALPPPARPERPEPRPRSKPKPKPKPAAKRRREDDEDDDFDRSRAGHDTGGSPVAVIAVGAAGLLCALAALGALVYTVFPSRDKEKEQVAAAVNAPAAKPKTDPVNPPALPPSVSYNPNAPAVPTPFAKQPAPNRPDPKVNPRPAPPAKFDRPQMDPPGGEPKAGGFALNPVPGRPVPLPPTELAGNGNGPLTVGLPGKVGDVAVGGGGRYLVLHFPERKKVAVFDVCTARIVREMDVIAHDAVLAAGMNKLVVVSAESRVLNQYSLPGLEPEFGCTPPGGDRKVIAVAMGSGTNGPLFVATFPELMLFDLEKRETVEGSVRFGGVGNAPLHPRVMLRASADGTTLTATWPMGATSGPSGVATVKGGKWVDAPVQFPHSAPAADGQTLFTEGLLFGPDGRALGPRVAGLSPGAKAWLVPAVSGNSFVKLAQKQTGAGAKMRWSITATIHADRDPATVLATVGPVPEADELPVAPTGAEAGFDKHVFLIPGAKVLAIIPPARDRIVLRRADVK